MDRLMSLDGGIGAAAAEIAERVGSSVVAVGTRGAGAGAGIIWRPDGTIVTNHHVAQRDEAGVVLADGHQLSARVIARDPHNDLAVLEVDSDHLPAATIGDARNLRVGELVLAVGHPFGIRNAVTVGVLSAKCPPDLPDQSRELIRADVLLGPGNSGGPLVDARGRVVGINSMVAGGLALAVPSHLAERLVAQAGGRPALGVGIRDVELPPAFAARAPVSSGRGAIVVKLVPGGAAERAGVMLGDVLVAVDGRPLAGADGLTTALAAGSHGPLVLGLLRGGVPREIVVLAAAPERRAA